MRKKWVLLALAGTASGGVAVGLVGAAEVGCSSSTCEDALNCAPGGMAEGGPDSPVDRHSGDVREGGKDVRHDHKDGMGLEGGDAEAGPSPCNASDTPHDNPCVISDTHGIFVAPAANGGSDTSGDGTRAKPFATFATAIPKAVTAKKRVYACGATYTESISIGTGQEGIEIYGGLQCPVAGDGGVADAGTVDSSMGPWSYTGMAAALAPAVTGYALDVESVAKGVHVEDMSFTAKPANPANPGESSIAVMVNNSAAVTFVRVGAQAGNGANGVVGGSLSSNVCKSSLSGNATSSSGGGAGGLCVDTGTPGNCPVYGSSGGGTGGGGGVPGLAGGGGTSTPATTLMVIPFDGDGGAGSNLGDSFTCANGHPGANGTARTGGAAGGTGSLNSAGWNTVLGGSGSAGNPGQGGGGGGGEDGVGANGGAGGGAGGCGGNGGGGGGGGGGSLAIAVVKSSVSFSVVTVLSAIGGQGGIGAQGEQGQAGGTGGFGASQCSGGNGGQGAGGSGGGGGTGGPSVGIGLASGSSVMIDGLKATPPVAMLSSPSSYTAGSGGAKGTGGPPGLAAPGGGGNPGQPGNIGSDGTLGAAGAVQSL